MHSTIEKNFDLVGEVQVPSQIAMIVKTAKKTKPLYKIHELETKDVMDWKSLAIAEQILKTRNSDRGNEINWTKMKVLHLKKNQPSKIFFKVNNSIL